MTFLKSVYLDFREKYCIRIVIHKGQGCHKKAFSMPKLLSSNLKMHLFFRIDGNGYDQSAAAASGQQPPLSATATAASDFPGQFSRSRSGSSDPRHLTGEMIRQMNAAAAAAGSGAKKADHNTIVASLADYQRQQIQMQAAYEKVLRVRPYKVQVSLGLPYLFLIMFSNFNQRNVRSPNICC